MPAPSPRSFGSANLLDRVLRRFTFEGRVRGEIGLLLTLVVVVSLLSAVLGRHAFAFESVLLVPGYVLRGEVWRLVTWPFVEVTPLQLVFSCLAIYWFGSELASVWGARRFLSIYAGIALLVGVLTTLLGLVDPAILGHVYGGLVALVSALVVAWGFLFPDRQMLLFFVLRLTGRVVAWFTIGLTIAMAAYYGWETVVPDLLAIGLMLLYLYRGRIGLPKRGGGGKPKRPSHLRAVPDEQRWH